MAIQDYLSGSNLGIIAGVLVILAIIWLIRNLKGGRIGLERHEIQEDKQLLATDKEIRNAAKYQKQDAKRLWDLINVLHSRLSQIGFNVPEQQKNNYDFILQGLQTISTEREGVFDDKKLIVQINHTIISYLRQELPNDAVVNETVNEIKSTQYILFKDIIEQDELLRRKWALLGNEVAETKTEAGLRPAA